MVFRKRPSSEFSHHFKSSIFYKDPINHGFQTVKVDGDAQSSDNSREKNEKTLLIHIERHGYGYLLRVGNSISILTSDDFDPMLVKR